MRIKNSGADRVFELTESEFRLLLGCVGETLNALWNSSEFETRVGISQGWCSKRGGNSMKA
jgi:hypothetical protein